MLWLRCFCDRLSTVRGLVLAIVVLFVPAAADASYSCALVGSTATCTGTAAGDTFTLTASGGLLRHNQAGDPAFASDADFDSTIAGPQTLAANAASTVNINTGGGNDVVLIGDATTAASLVLATITVTNAGADGDTLTVDDSISATANTIGVTSTAITGTGINVTRAGATFGTVTVRGGSNNDTINLAGAVGQVVLDGGAGSDAFVFANGASTGGTIVGGAGTDTINYAAYSSAVSVNLGSNAPGLAASLDGDQQAPPIPISATGTATATYNSVAKLVDVTVTVDGILPTDVIGFHIHAAPFGVNGNVIVDFGAGPLTPVGTGFTFAGTFAVPADQEAALLGGLTYINIHTPAFPGGAIRGQLFPSGLFVASTGTATGTAGISTIENVIGGLAGDSLVGDLNANVLQGGAGDDALVGSRGNDTLGGDADNDALVWSNGDGTDVMNGATGIDLVQVNGNPTGLDDFLISAGAGGRLAFSRATGPFALDIGTVETLAAIGIGGDDTMTVNNLTGVADLAALRLAGLAGNDTINASAMTLLLATTITGGSGTDTLTGGPGVDAMFGGTGDDTLSSLGGADALDGGEGNDNLLGGVGIDTFRGGAGADTMTWNPGDANDVMDGDAGTDTVQFNGANGAEIFTVVPNGARVTLTRNVGAITMDIGTTEQINVAGLDGDDTFTVTPLVGTAVAIDGGAGTDVLNVADAANGAVSTYAVDATRVMRSGTSNITSTNVETRNVNGGSNGNTYSIAGTSSGTSLVGGAGTDTFAFADGASIGGTIDGAAGSDTISYAAYTTAASVNLGSNAPGLSADLDGDQEVPPTSPVPTGAATVTYNSVAKTVDVNVTVVGITPAEVIGFHIHSAAFGVNGPIIVDFGTGSLTPAGTGFTFAATGLALPPAQEAALLGGLTYVNVHSPTFPGGAIRGQLFPTGLFVAATGTATGTAGISNIENVTGGSAADSLVGDLNANVMQGGAGDDAIVGSRGNDTLGGDADNDALVWSNGDGTDVMNGGIGSDLVQVNGNPTGLDDFQISAGAGGRLAFSRATGPFALDIGTVETLAAIGIGGTDTMAVNNLTGVADLTALRLAGLAGNDTINASAMTVSLAITITGGAGNDTLTGGPGVDAMFGGTGDDTLSSLGGADALDGGDGTDNLLGGVGVDTFRGGPGTDTMTWNPGDGNDVMDGDAGADTVQFNGANAPEIFTVTPTGARVTLTRNVGNITMDIGTTETVNIPGLDGDDTFNITALTTTTVSVDGGNPTAPPGDILNFNGQNLLVTQGSGVLTAQGRQPVQFTGIETVNLLNPAPTIAINDVAATEGNSGTTTATFTATLSGPSGLPITVNYATADGTASSTDYTTASGILSFAAGETSKTALVSILGDRVVEPTETFTVNLSNPTNVTIADGLGIGTILDNDIAPTIQITSPSATGAYTATAPFLTMAGTASDDLGIQNITWVNNRGGSGTATGTTSWTIRDIVVQAGVNVITVTANDVDSATPDAGDTRNATSATLTVTVNEFVYYLAEGATGAFFDLDVLIANPTAGPAPVTVTFLKEDATTIDQTYTLPAQTRLTIPVETIGGLASTAVSTVVRSTTAVPLIVERTMTWDAAGYGSHGGAAVEGARTQWLFAEGSQGFFDTFILLANANPQPATVTVTFLTEFDGPVVATRVVAANARLNLWAREVPQLVGKSFSIVVTSTIPIIAERAMYFPSAATVDPSGRRLFEGGHEAAGVTEAATTWFHAEGATGSFFDTYILVGNPNAAPTTATFTWLLETGETVVKQKSIPANSRLTVWVDGEDPKLANAPAVSTTVVATLPVISERAMYWPGTFAQWFEAHDSFGVTATATKWGLAEGRVGGALGFDTFILLANPTTTAAQVRVTYLRESGAPIVKTYTVGATSRRNIWVNAEVPELVNERFGAVVEVLNGVGIAVERALYNASGGVAFAAGTNATGTRIP